MLQNRLDLYGKKRSQLDLRDRHPELMKVEGWYDVVSFPEYAKGYYEEYVSSGARLKFTRWLARVKKLDAKVLSQLGKDLTETSFKISCRHNDLMRLGDTDHYTSCMKNHLSMGRQQLLYIADPDVAVVFVPDASGKFLWRTLLRLAYSPAGTLSLVAYRVYGNGPTDAIYQTIEERTGLKVYYAVDIKRRAGRARSLRFVSPTVHNNKNVTMPVWTDHLVGMTQQRRIYIEVEDPRSQMLPERSSWDW